MSERSLDAWSSALGDRAVALGAEPPPFWLDVAFKLALSTLDRRAKEAIADHTLPRDAFPAAYTVTRLGYAARRAECEALDLHERNPELTAVIADGFAHGVGEDWFETITRAAAALLSAAEDVPDPRTEGVLAPEGMGHAARARLGEAMVDATISEPARPPMNIGWVDRGLLRRCWLYGYYLSACAASLPPEAAQHLPSTDPDG
jgi:hypothetical protein